MEPPTGPALTARVWPAPSCAARRFEHCADRARHGSQWPAADPQALVYIPESPGPLSPIAAALGCEACNRPLSDRTVAVTQTGIDGRFTLRGVPAGERIPVVIQKGRFRRRFEMTIAPCQTQAVTALAGRQPGPARLDERRGSATDGRRGRRSRRHRVRAARAGHRAGRISGADDPSSGEPTSGRVHLYNNQAPGAPTLPGQPQLSTLLRDRERMLRYPLIFLNCSGRRTRSRCCAIRRSFPTCATI